MMKNLVFKMFVMCMFMLASTTQANAQLGDILNKVVSKVTGTDQVTEANLVGTWTFTGSGIELKSSSENELLNTITNAGASSVVEKKLDSYLSKIGMIAGKFTIVFHEDKTFQVTTSKGKKTSGTYSISEDKKSVILQVATFKATCSTEISSTDLKLMVSADKIITLASTLTSVASSNSTMKLINQLLSNYKGMDAGLKFTKK